MNLLGEGIDDSEEGSRDVFGVFVLDLQADVLQAQKLEHLFHGNNIIKIHPQPSWQVGWTSSRVIRPSLPVVAYNYIMEVKVIEGEN